MRVLNERPVTIDRCSEGVVGAASIKLVAGIVTKSTLAKQNGDSMTEKQNILRPSLKVTIHQPLLIM